MKTPVSYNKNLKAGIITEEMLANCLYSVNKRAKNCRDKVREYKELYRRYYDLLHFEHDYIDSYRQKREEYYEMKDELLSILEPVCIHREFAGWTYDDEMEYRYYRFYELGEYSFHSPVREIDVKETYKDLDVIDINTLKTKGRDITDLISVTFVRKVLELIESGNYELAA